MAMAGENVTVEHAVNATQYLIRSPNKLHYIIDNDEIPDFVPHMSVPVLPIEPIGDDYAPHGAKHIIDIVVDHSGETPKELLAELSKKKRLAEAPVPFNNREPTAHEHEVSIYVVKQTNGMVTIIRHIEFVDKKKLGLLRSVCHGTPSKIMWDRCGSSTRSHIKIFQYFLEGLPGFHLRAHRLAPQGEKKNPMGDDDDVDGGFDFIINEAPRSNTNLAKERWVTKAIRQNSGSPIEGWPATLVDKAIREMTAQGSLAQTQTYFPLTLADFEPQVMDTIFNIYESLRKKTIVFLSVPGLGKTPLSMAILMSLSRDSGDTQGPYFRMTSELDFLRGEPGTYGRGDLFDDGDTSAQNPRSLKAFLDVSLLEAAIWARWGGIRLAKGQPRIICENKIDIDAEGQVANDVNVMTHKQFLDLIRPMFPDRMAACDIDAVMKRANFIVQTNDFFYFREANEASVNVTRVSLADRDNRWISPESRSRYCAFLNGDIDQDDTYDERIAWERTWAAAAVGQGNKPRPYYTRQHQVACVPPVQEEPCNQLFVEFSLDWESVFETTLKRFSQSGGSNYYIVVETPSGERVDMLSGPVLFRKHFPLTLRRVQKAGGCDSSSSTNTGEPDAKRVKNETSGAHFCSMRICSEVIDLDEEP